MSLLALGHDILAFYVLPRLSPNDLTALCETCHALKDIIDGSTVWHSLYVRQFAHSGAEVIPGDWPEKFKLRERYRLFAWGQCNFSAYGHQRRIDYPSETPGMGELSVRQIYAGSHGIVVLSTDNDAYMLGDINPRYGLAIRLRGRPVPMPFRTAANQLARLWPENKLIHIAAGRDRILGIDTQRIVWCWSDTKLSSGHRYDDIIGARQVAVSWNVCACICDWGLVIWWGSPDDEKIKVECDATQVAAGENFVVFVTPRGELAAIDATNSETISQGPTVLDEIGNVVKIDAGYNRFGAITSDGEAIVARRTSGINFDILSRSRGEFIDIALGDHHNLALSKDGAVYAWGTESQGCGSLGLGGRDSLAAIGAGSRPIRFGREDYNLHEPHLVTKGPAVEISAGGWQSYALLPENHD